MGNRGLSLLPKVLGFLIALLSMLSCSTGTDKRSVKLRQYIVQGRQLYEVNCANCHQLDGGGLARVYPPLKNSDYLQKMDLNDLACQIKFGIGDTLIVNGVLYHMQMPGVPSLTALEIAEIISFVDNEWGGERGLYSVKQAEKALLNCASVDIQSPL